MTNSTIRQARSAPLAKHTFVVDRELVGRPRRDGLSVLWAFKFLILGIAAIGGVITYFASNTIAPTYSSSSEVRLAVVPVAGNSVADTIAGSNNLAAEFAQVATSSSVVGPAASALGANGRGLTARVSAAAVANQNLVRVTVQGRTIVAAQAGAKAMAQALVNYAAAEGAAAADAYGDAFTAQLKSLDGQIAQTQQAISADVQRADGALPGTSAITTLATDQSLLSELILRRQEIQTQVTTNEVALVPAASVVSVASAATKVSPHPRLYAGVAVVGGGLTAFEFLALLERRRGLNPRQGHEDRSVEALS